MRMNMDDIMQQALNITRAQAGVRPMSASEVAAYAAEIAKGIRTILESEPEEEDFESGENTAPACDPKRSIKENSIICLECGRSFRVLTKCSGRSAGRSPQGQGRIKRLTKNSQGDRFFACLPFFVPFPGSGKKQHRKRADDRALPRQAGYQAQEKGPGRKSPSPGENTAPPHEVREALFYGSP